MPPIRTDIILYCADRMRNYFMYDNKRRKKFVVDYPKIFATGRHWGTPKSRWGGGR